VTLSDVLVIGAGQAGLAAGYHLKRAGLSFEIVDAGNRIGDSWRSRYASLTLFTPRAFSALPGMDMPGDPDGYPSRDEFADYLEAYTERFDIRVTLNAKVTSLGHSQQGFAVRTRYRPETCS
jgi:putative flavoprotein involved in K+ transport